MPVEHPSAKLWPAVRNLDGIETLDDPVDGAILRMTVLSRGQALCSDPPRPRPLAPLCRRGRCPLHPRDHLG